VFDSEQGWKRTLLMASGPFGHEPTRGYFRDGLALYKSSQAGQLKRRPQHWSVVLLRTGQVVLTIRARRQLAVKIAGTLLTMIDWNDDALSIDRAGSAAQTKLMEAYGDALRFDADFMINQEYMKWIGQHIWAVVYPAAAPLPAWPRQPWLQHTPLGIGQVTRIAQARTAMLPPGGRGPHRKFHPRCRNPLESRLPPAIHPRHIIPTSFRGSL
jgi:hypothetical protein